MQKAGLLLCAIVFAFAPTGEAAADPGGRIMMVERVAEGGDAVAWTLTASKEVVAAIEGAAIATGADFDFLLRTAALESSFDTELEAKTSTATGLYQFIERTWLLMMRAHGARAGLDTLASAVTFGEKGECDVTDALMRDEILALRNDVELAAFMAAVLARQNASDMARALGRAPESAELYIGHVMGATGGAKLIRLADSKPKQRADKVFRRAARANRTIFYDGRKPRSLDEVRDVIAAKYAALRVKPAVPPTQVVAVSAPIRLASE
ncbi:MAG TPA: hypothetical protein VFY21_04175 [Xanthobacteraceae bacterium]|nr:hypothetical protein [Xanthobacteraceae bacterium]